MAAKQFRKFGDEPDATPNPWGIKNKAGKVVTTAYLRRYLMCWTRNDDGYRDQPAVTDKDGKVIEPAVNKDAIYDKCLTDEWMATRKHLEASQVGHECARMVEWGSLPARMRAARKAAKPVEPAPLMIETAVAETSGSDPEAAAFAAAFAELQAAEASTPADQPTSEPAAEQVAEPMVIEPAPAAELIEEPVAVETKTAKHNRKTAPVAA